MKIYHKEYTTERQFLARVGLVSLVLWPIAIISFLIYLHGLLAMLNA